MAIKKIPGVEVDAPNTKTNVGRLDDFGREIPDGRPMAPPIGYKRTPSLSEQIRDMVQSERLAQELASTGAETFEESEDFDVGDDVDPHSPWEQYFEPTELAELQANYEAARAANQPPPPEPGPKAPEPPAAAGAAPQGPKTS